MFKSLFSNPVVPLVPDAPEEHHIALGGEVEIAFHHTTKTVFYIDRTGGAEAGPLNDLLEYYKGQGWFLHAIAALPPAQKTEGEQ